MGSALLSQWVNGPEAITVVDPAGSDVPDGVALVTDRSEIVRALISLQNKRDATLRALKSPP